MDVVPSSAPRSHTQGRALPGMSDIKSVDSPPTITSTSPKPVLSRSSSRQDTTSDTSFSSPHTLQKRSPSGSTIVMPALARPVQPQVVVQPSPVAIASQNPSPAFLRVAPSTQDLHPSLSRLQGRGFVEQRVKASSELYGGSPSQQEERGTSSGPSPQRPTILDRWQPALVSRSPSPSLSKTPLIQRESTNMTPGVSPSKSVQQLIRPRTTSPGLVKPRVEEAIQERAVPVRLPGLANFPSFPPRQRTILDSSVSTGSPGGPRIIGNSEGAHRNQRDMSSVTGPLSHVSLF